MCFVAFHAVFSYSVHCIHLCRLVVVGVVVVVISGADPGVQIGGAIWRARAYNASLGAVPQARSRGRARGQGAKPP